MNKLIKTFLIVFILGSSVSVFAQIEVQKIDEKWTFLVNGAPYAVKGVTFGHGNDIANYDSYFKDLNFLGVNTIRTWATNENTSQLLDAAEKYGIKVMVGIWMRHGRPGMEDDDSFDYISDEDGKLKMYNNAIETVNKYKNHPAILTWGIGNEVILNITTDQEKEAYAVLLESICKEIKRIDTDHPLTSVDAWTFGLDWWYNHVPSLDIYGLNVYGQAAGFLSQELSKRGIDKPYLITEYGVTGEWDIKVEKQGVKVEPSDQQKYSAILKGYNELIRPELSCLGVFVFHYADGNKHMAPWLFTHYDSMYRPQYWAIREAYTGKRPVNHPPSIHQVQIADTIQQSDTWVPVVLDLSDLENDSLNISFSYNQRTGSRKRRDQINILTHRGNIQDGYEIKLPKENGPIKIYAIAEDTYHNVGIASTSIMMQDEIAKNKKYLVPKVNLPFYVYQDGESTPYAPSAYMGNTKSINIDMRNKEDVHSGTASFKINYDEDHDWYGLGLVDPANDWGDILGGYDISEAQTFSFWAKANTKVKATIGFGLIGKDKKYPDTAKESIELQLTTKWKKYSIKTKKLDLSCIRSGFVLFSQGYLFGHTIYIDDVVFE